MGVEYKGIGGIGIELTGDMIAKIIKSGVFEEDDWHENKEECFCDLDIRTERAGNAYTGEETVYLFVNGKNLAEINRNKIEFIEKLQKCGIDLSDNDLIVIRDFMVF